MNYKINQLPFDQFQMLGMDKRDIINLPTRTLNALLTGNRTSLMRFNNLKLPGMGNPLSIDAKLSLANNNGNLQLKIHPINKEAANIYQLSPTEIKQLETDQTNFISKSIPGIDGKSKNLLIGLDKTTNEYVGIDKEKINAPEEINGIALSDQQKANFKEGRSVHIDNTTFKLDPNNEIGVSGRNNENEKAEIQSLRFKHSRYSSKELLADSNQQSSNVIMIGHINDMARDNSIPAKKQQDMKTAISPKKRRKNNLKL